jgi:hypothetical protein
MTLRYEFLSTNVKDEERVNVSSSHITSMNGDISLGSTNINNLQGYYQTTYDSKLITCLVHQLQCGFLAQTQPTHHSLLLESILCGLFIDAARISTIRRRMAEKVVA